MKLREGIAQFDLALLDYCITERIAQDELKREPRWTEAIAVGSEDDVRRMAERIEGRQQVETAVNGQTWTLQEAGVSYASFLAGEIACNNHRDR